MENETLQEIMAKYFSDTFTGVHPAADLFPMIPDDELAELTEDIRLHGLQTPIMITADSKLLDGRNRLVACARAGVEIRTVRRREGEDYIGVVISANLKRRNLTTSQRAMLGHSLREMFDAEAKALRNHNDNNTVWGKISSSNVPRETISVVSLPPTDSNKARDLAGKAVGVSGSYIDRARDVAEHAPGLVAKVRAGEMTLNAAVKVAEPAKREAAQAKASPLYGTAVNLEGEHRPVRMAEVQRFNETNDSVSWASWTWNPVTGCNHGCNFCYARAITHNPQMSANYPHGFDPALYEYRLSAPKNMKVKPSDNPADGRVFVGSMADLFGKWVPDEWIEKVFNACMESPEWEYLFLTKWPKRYNMLASLPKAWFGASIIKQADVARVERDMKAFETKGVKWVSLEPMLEPIVFSDLSWCDLMVIGSQTGTNQPEGYVPPLPAHFEWVAAVVAQCRAAGVPVYLKPNLLTKPGMDMPMEAPRRS